MTADELLDRLERDRLVKSELLAGLRGQVKQSAKPVAAATIAKLLVDKGHLTSEQSQQLLAASASPAVAAPAAAAPAKIADPLDDLMGLAPLDDDPRPNPTPPKPAAATKPAAAAKPAASPAKPAASPAKPTAAAVDELQSLDDLQPLDGLDALESLDGLDPLDGGDPLGAAVIPLDDAPAPMSSLDGPQPLMDLSAGGDLFGASLGDPLAQPGTAAAGGRQSAGVATAGLPPGARVQMQPAAGAPAAKRPGLALAISGGIFAAVVIGIVAAIALIPKPTGDPEFAAAEADYQAKQYGAAVPKYAAFVEQFSHHPQIGAARVHHAWSRIQQVAGGSQKDRAAILPVAKDSLTSVGSETQISELHAELAPLLTDMAVALVDAARQAKTSSDAAAQLSLAKDALALANDSRFVPGNLRDWQRLAAAEESLATIAHEAGRDAAAEAAQAAMKQALAAKDLPAVYAAREKLLAGYPAAANDAPLRTAMQEAAKLEAARAQKVTDFGPPTSSTPAPEIEIFAGAAPAGAPVVFCVGATAWGVDSASGRLLWQAPQRGYLPPAYLPGGKVVLVDLSRSEVVCLAPAGTIAWRFSLAGPLVAAPLVAGQQVIVASSSGRVVALDAATGAPSAAVQLPQSVLATPAFDQTSGNVYVAAAAHHVYVLAAADLSCKSAFYLGHEAGADIAPIIAGRRLVVVENRGVSAMLFAATLADDGALQGQPQQERLKGTAASPPVAMGPALVAVTDRTAVVFELPTSATARLKRLGEANAAGIAVASGDRLWIGGAGLWQYEVRTSGDLLTPVSSTFPDSAIVVQPQVGGALVVAARAEANQPAAVAFALQASDAKRLWETPLTIARGPKQ